MTAAAATAAWCLSNLPAWWRYRRALDRPAHVQRRLLLEYVRRNAGTVFGTAHGFERIRSVGEYQRRVPLMRYEEYEPFVRRIAAGEPRVLTAEPVRRLAVTGGSTAGPKLIPYTPALQAEYARGVGPWIAELYCRQPSLAGGRAYWSITPKLAAPSVPGAVIPVGFDEDSQYLGGLAHRFVERAMAVPGWAAALEDHDAHRYVTLLLLLRTADLRLISVWHPSYLTLLLDSMRARWHGLLEDVRRGGVTAEMRLPERLADALARRLRPDPPRARALRAAGPESCDRIWPALGLVSCWGDAAARGSVADLHRRLPGVRIQPKGLLATEAMVTLPFGADGARPLAIRSHFFEFIDAGGDVALAHELERGATYEVAVTTGGGLYRYRLGDLVRVDGVVGRTPSLTFLGRAGDVSDLVGEKLQEAFVAGVIAALFQGRPAPSFAMLAPERTPRGWSYTLFVETEDGVPPDLEARLERGLSANPHYALAVRLGQLAPSRAVRIRGGFGAFAGRAVGSGRRLGDVKPRALDGQGNWSDVFTPAAVAPAAAVQDFPLSSGDPSSVAISG